MLDFIDPELPDLPGERPPRHESMAERCGAALANFKQYARDIASSAAGHTLAIVKSFYPAVRLDLIESGFAQGSD